MHAGKKVTRRTGRTIYETVFPSSIRLDAFYPSFCFRDDLRNGCNGQRAGTVSLQPIPRRSCVLAQRPLVRSAAVAPFRMEGPRARLAPRRMAATQSSAASRADVDIDRSHESGGLAACRATSNINQTPTPCRTPHVYGRSPARARSISALPSKKSQGCGYSKVLNSPECFAGLDYATSLARRRANS
jgi:hypothetical protein